MDLNINNSFSSKNNCSLQTPILCSHWNSKKIGIAGCDYLPVKNPAQTGRRYDESTLRNYRPTSNFSDMKVLNFIRFNLKKFTTLIAEIIAFLIMWQKKILLLIGWTVCICKWYRKHVRETYMAVTIDWSRSMILNQQKFQ